MDQVKAEVELELKQHGRLLSPADFEKNGDLKSGMNGANGGPLPGKSVD